MIILLVSCSVRQDKWANRFWHSLNTHYNGYFNGNEALKEATQIIAKAHKDDYYSVISPFRYGTKETAQSAASQLDRTIKKGVLMIRKHSMLINGKQRNKWIDDCYLIMGQANFFKREHSQALQQLQYVLRTSENPKTQNIARLWIIKTYIDQGEFTLAENEFNKIGYPDWEAGLKSDYFLTLADFFIKQDEYKPAVIPLLEALKYLKRKRQKSRPHFILGQIYQKAGLCDVAREHFALARRYKPDFEMEFQASVNLALCTPLDANNEELKKTLRKLAKEEKNADYRDQIFYALAILAQKEGKEEEAISLYAQSAASSTKNPNQKGLSYLALAEIFLARQDYVKSNAYYDSCLANLSKKHPDYEKLKALKENMGEIARLLGIVHYEDSLLAVAALPENERFKLTEKFVERLRKYDEKQKNQELSKPLAGPSVPTNLADAITAAGKWYFYNSTLVASGFKEFQKIWGNRKNEDNWRRKNKNPDPLAIQNPSGSENPSVQAEKEEDRYSVETYLKRLPLSDSSKKASLERIYDALYALGLIYKEKLKNYSEAIKTLENLERRNSHKYVPVLYYQLYILARLTNNQSLADRCRNIILERYPQSEYAQILTDPEYMKKLALRDKRAEALYEMAYQEYKMYRWAACRMLCQQGLEEYPNTSVAPRFALLKAKALGGLEGREGYIKSLQEVVHNYPGTESATEAQKILSYLGLSASDSSGKAPLASNKPQNLEGKEENEPYVVDNYSPHFVVLTLPEGAHNTAMMQKLIAQFNQEYYSLQTFDISAVVVGGADNGVTCLVIKEFNGRDPALEYMRMLITSPEMEEHPEGFVDSFVITKQNLVKLIQRGNIQEYLRFYYAQYKTN
ncbi:MAG: tetratricopeptide repeat protein [Flavobacteriales bacterium]|nr:tetratricopeptide repeat protein [Flavobacteriales bacterium]MCX7767428.1 tetratricopeptide repeat protein [Flavobacteriales bacterium]MDW8410058.1 tetratricopeptide repeat protein [Flavobacteriales bacterium]